jgi:hypothetical protein
MSRPRLAILFIALAAAALYLNVKTVLKIHITTSPVETVYTFSPLAAVLTAAAAVFAFAAAFFFATAKLGLFRLFALLPASLGLLLSIATYDVATDHLTITPTTLLLPGRGLCSRPYERLVLSDLLSVMVTSDGENRQMEFYKKDHSRVTIPLGDLMRAAQRDIVKAPEASDIPLVDD